MSPDPQAEIRQLSAGIRAFAVTVVGILAYIGGLIAIPSGVLGLVFHNMFGGKPLPALTGFILTNGPLLLALYAAYFIVAVCIALFVRNHRTALFSLSLVLLAIGIQLAIVIFALNEPFHYITPMK